MAGESPLVLSYLSLRRSIGAIGMALPFALALGGLLVASTSLQTSVSRYYHTALRDVLVGSLCAIAVFLWSYYGYDRRDRIAGNLACVFALAVALFPTAPENPTRFDLAISRVHAIAAGGFFLTLAYFSLVLFRLSDDPSPTKRKLQRNLVYEACGYIILACILAIGVLAVVPGADGLKRLRPVFWLEASAIVAFGVSWAVKGETVLKDQEPESSQSIRPRIPPRTKAAAETESA